MKEAIESFQQYIGDNVILPAARFLFTVEKNCEQLIEEKNEIIYSVTAKILYIINRARPYLETTLPYLYNIVSCRNEDGWKKLERLLKYIKGTINDVSIIGSSSLKDLDIRVDTAYAVHNYMCSHTGVKIMLGWGTLHCKSTQKN